MNWHNILIYENPILSGRCIKKQIASSEDEFSLLFLEFKKYAYLASANHSQSLPMLAKSIDEIWHEFILLTRDYNNFCQSYLGAFLHHHPIKKSKQQQNNALDFFALYKDQFGEVPTVWLRQDGSCAGSCSASDIDADIRQHTTADCQSSGD